MSWEGYRLSTENPEPPEASPLCRRLTWGSNECGLEYGPRQLKCCFYGFLAQLYYLCKPCLLLCKMKIRPPCRAVDLCGSPEPSAGGSAASPPILIMDHFSLQPVTMNSGLPGWRSCPGLRACFLESFISLLFYSVSISRTGLQEIGVTIFMAALA